MDLDHVLYAHHSYSPRTPPVETMTYFGNEVLQSPYSTRRRREVVIASHVSS